MRPRELTIGFGLGLLLWREWAHRRKGERAERFAAAALESLLRAVDANDDQTGAHVRRVAEYALVLADALRLNEKDRRTVELAALFHDIGKIHEALFDIVHEPRTLTAAERRAIATHPARGAEVLAPIAAFYPELAEAVLCHHERWDGTGYPRRLRGERIPLAARIVAVADTFDAVTYRRRYRDGRAARQAATVLQEARGAQFDPELVDLALRPEVFHRLQLAHRKWCRLGRRLPHRDGRAIASAPRIRIRWRSRSDPPPRLHQQLAESNGGRRASEPGDTGGAGQPEGPTHGDGRSVGSNAR